MNLGPGKEFDRIRGIIERIAEITGDSSELGDDCALIALGSTNLAISIDNSLENVHFRTDWLDFKEIGCRAACSARSDKAEQAARQPISLKSSQSVRKWTFSSELSMLIARFVEPNAINAQSSPSSELSPVISAIRSMMPRMRSNSLPGPRFMGRSFLQHLWSLKFH